MSFIKLNKRPGLNVFGKPKPQQVEYTEEQIKQLAEKRAERMKQRRQAEAAQRRSSSLSRPKPEVWTRLAKSCGIRGPRT